MWVGEEDRKGAITLRLYRMKLTCTWLKGASYIGWFKDVPHVVAELLLPQHELPVHAAHCPSVTAGCWMPDGKV